MHKASVAQSYTVPWNTSINGCTVPLPFIGAPSTGLQLPSKKTLIPMMPLKNVYCTGKF